MNFWDNIVRRWNAGFGPGIAELDARIESLENQICVVRDQQRQTGIRHKEELDKANSDAKVAVEVIRERMRSPEQAWVEGAQLNGSRTANREAEGKLDILRKALQSEKAYTLFLEDCLECHNPADVFNALPLEKRQEYFSKVQ